MASGAAALLREAKVIRDQSSPHDGLLRFLLELPAPTDRNAADNLLVALRNAVVHEGRITELLASAGTSMDVDDVVSILADALHAMAAHPARRRATAGLPEAETAEFRAVGVDTGDMESPGTDPRVSTAVQYASLLATALTTREAAALLGVEESRVRQRLLDRSLYGIKAGRAWRLPTFQFTSRGVVPGLSHVLPHLPHDMHPVAVWRWLTAPASDLLVDDAPAAPLEWLAAGHEPDPLAAIADEL